MNRLLECFLIIVIVAFNGVPIALRSAEHARQETAQSIYDEPEAAPMPSPESIYDIPTSAPMPSPESIYDIPTSAPIPTE